MKTVVRKSLKLDLPYVLGVLVEHGRVSTSELIPMLQERFDCRPRAIQDALSILTAGGWIVRERDPRDLRRTRYTVTRAAIAALECDEGWRDLRIARWLYSTTSTRARTRRNQTFNFDPTLLPMFAGSKGAASLANVAFGALRATMGRCPASSAGTTA